MPIINTAATTETNSRAVRFARMKRIVAGELKAGAVPVGEYHVQIKTATIYNNPTTHKTSYRCDVEITEGVHAGKSLLVFTSVAEDDRVVEMLLALGLADEDNLGLALDQDAELLRIMQGKTARISRVVKDATKPLDITSNWVVPSQS